MHQPPADSTESESGEPDEQDGRDRLRRRVMIGGAATVGLVALISIGHTMGDEVVVARCVDDRNVVVDKANCPDRAGPPPPPAPAGTARARC